MSTLGRAAIKLMEPTSGRIVFEGEDIAAYWRMGMESAISPTRSVDIVGNYQPLESGFSYKELVVVPQVRLSLQRKPPRKYDSATAFRVALEDRLKRLAQEENIDLQRVRRQATFDRLLCRLFAKPDGPWLLKGG